MKYVKTFEEYNNELIVEKLNLGGLFDKLKNSVDKAPIVSIIVGSLLTVLTVTQAANFISDQNILTKIEKSEILNLLKKKDESPNKLKTIKNVNVKQGNIYDHNNDINKLESRRLLDPLSIKLSEDGLNHIKKFERLKLKAYSIGDGMVTIGYGHAERKRKSKYKIGDKISKEEANKLLQQDLQIATAGVKRIFNQWKKS